MANVKNNMSARETRRRLLEAAGEVFADKGFHSATIKEITERAEACVAAVNYHFSDKASLYASVLDRIAEEASQIVPPDRVLIGAPEERFRAFVHHMITTMLGRGQPAWERILLAREFARPSLSLDTLLRNVVEPLNAKLSAIVADLMGLDRRHRAVTPAVISVIAQCVYFLQHDGHLVQLFPALSSRPSNRAIADHVVEFSLRALRRDAAAAPRASSKSKSKTTRAGKPRATSRTNASGGSRAN